MSKTITGLILVYAYLRVSSKRQADKNLSIPAQKKAVRAWAAQQGLKIDRFYIDAGFSAFREDVDRPAFNEMIYDAKRKGGVDILVYKYDRFSRDRLAGAAAQYELKKAGSRLLSTLEDLDDSENPMASINAAIVEAIAQMQSAQISSGVRRSNMVKAERGSFPGSRAPYGYDRVKIDGVYVCPISSTSAEVVRRIFRRCIDGTGGPAIAWELNEAGIPSPSGRDWVQSSINAILRNPAYKGALVWSGKTYPDFFKPIVTAETWQAAENALLDRTRNPRGRPKKRSGGSILTNLLYGHCGHKYYFQARQNSASKTCYVCSVKIRHGAKSCESPNVPAEESEKEVLQAVLDVALDPETMGRLREKTIQAHKDRKPQQELAKAQRKIAAIETKRDRLLDAVENGLDAARAGKRDKKLAAQLESLKDTVRQIVTDETQGPGLQKSWDTVEAYAATIRKHWQDMPRALAQEVVRAFVRRVVVMKSGKLKIHFGYPPGGTLPPVNRTPKRGKQRKSGGTEANSPACQTGNFGTVKTVINPDLDLARTAHTTPNVRKNLRGSA